MRYITLRDGRIYVFDKMKVMGILNATPDSFYSNSRVSGVEKGVKRALDMIKNGADIIDVGGESTRPGSEPIGLDEELNRVIPLIEGIRRENKEILISVDTYRAETAKKAIEAGADIINDISGMTFDKDMVRVVKDYNVPIIIMHIKGTPKNMQQNPQYENVLKEVKEYFIERIEYAIENGISKDKIIIDPGIGFGKTYEHNIELIKNIEFFNDLEVPVLLAVSRKSSIGIALGNVPPEERLEGTIAVTCYASMKNVDIIRVHDVLENKRALMMMEALK
ncbi:dihydropteroate synthase [Caloramator proteoclasticus]|uniref:Dihydropteroate synthase n=1 Tax=Caloramator proteoclasticus DSM 10124 TaxID=1121262 RepID=A0A1M5AG23_9CLOT|nr:dihydropteroate synthase [Caloramator proteoclasticus]SHF29076.1 dihydropteroate synthase [Caloramator proteoclasticus DSM 10124]